MGAEELFFRPNVSRSRTPGTLDGQAHSVVNYDVVRVAEGPEGTVRIWGFHGPDAGAKRGSNPAREQRTISTKTNSKSVSSSSLRVKRETPQSTATALRRPNLAMSRVVRVRFDALGREGK